MIDEKNPLTKDGMFILEHQSNESIATNLTNLTLQKTRILGNTTISFFTKLGG